MFRPADIREVLTRRPFRPVRLVLTDGTRYEITHPEAVVVGFTSLRVAIAATDLPRRKASHDVLVALVHIIRIEPAQHNPVTPVSR